MAPSVKSRLRWRLYDAAGQGDDAAVSRLLAAGADPNASVTIRTRSGDASETTTLWAAVGHGQVEAVRRLLDAGAGASLAGSEGDTPLMTAAGSGQLEVLQLLLERGVVVDAMHPVNSSTAFHVACITNQAECAEALVMAGCDVTLKTIDGRTGREVAEAHGHDTMAAQLYAWQAERPAGGSGTPGSGGGGGGGGGGGRGGPEAPRRSAKNGQRRNEQPTRHRTHCHRSRG
jgi:hypothetical protein